MGRLPMSKATKFYYIVTATSTTTLYLYKGRKSQCKIKLPHPGFSSNALACGPDNRQCYMHKHFKFLQYEFRVNFWLRVNLSLNNIYFSSASVNLCRQGHIQIESNAQIEHKNWLRYCGIHPSVSAYPPFHIFDLFVQTWAFVIARAEMSFSVFDSDQLVSYVMFPSSENPRWIFYLYSHGLVMEISTIQVNHVNTVVVNVSSEAFQLLHLYDGPGTKSELLTKSSSHESTTVFVGSSFVVTVHCLTKTSQNKEVIALAYQSQLASVKQMEVFEETVVLSFPLSPTPCSQTSVCVLKLVSSNHTILNITLSNFTHKGDENPERCVYAGIAVYDTLETSLEKLSVDCVKPQHKQHFERYCGSRHEGYFLIFHQVTSSKFCFPKSQDVKSLYSNTSSPFLVFYSFSEYASFTMHFGASATNCTSYILDSCKTYKEHLSVLGMEIYRILWKHQCSIFQLRALSHHNIYCHKIVAIEHISTSGKRMSVSVTGHLGGKGSFSSAFKFQISNARLLTAQQEKRWPTVSVSPEISSNNICRCWSIQ